MRREALVQWCSRPEFTHALSLVPNRKNITVNMLRSMYGAFCLEVDRYLLGVKHPHRRFSIDRLHAIAFPEMLEGNPHLHCVANFCRTHWQHQLDKPWTEELPQIWKEVTRGAGELRLERKVGNGWERYITKEALRHDHDFFLSMDFHPADRITDNALYELLETLK